MWKQTGRQVQSKARHNFSVGLGIAVAGYPADVEPTDCVLFIDRMPTDAIDAQLDGCSHKITALEKQSAGYAAPCRFRADSGGFQEIGLR